MGNTRASVFLLPGVCGSLQVIVMDSWPELSSHGFTPSCVVKVSDHCRHVMSLSPVPLNTRRVGERCMLNLSKAQTSSRWCSVVEERGASSGTLPPRYLTMDQNYEIRCQKLLCN
ncbi:uncharacterized protein TNCV_2867511 [Trichonephila clavipes]|nr:uncharacterized protein TNCV_2867511 [Trichonephila clavipes]